MAPEICEGKEYDGKNVDVFALGVILYVMVNGSFPFKDSSCDDYYFNLLQTGEYKQYWKDTKTEHLSVEFKDLFIKMTSYNPEDRPTIDEIINHPWMNIKDVEIDTNASTNSEQEPSLC